MSSDPLKPKKDELENYEANGVSTVDKPGLSVVSGHGNLADSQPTPEDAHRDAPRVDLKYLLKALVKYNASDLHIKAGRPPLYRINGKLIPAKMEQLSVEKINEIVSEVLTERHLRDLDKNLQIDFSFRLGDFGRFRCNVFYQRGQLSAVIRMIPITIPNLNDIAVPDVIKELCKRQRGLILVTGSTGMGKSTTLSAMVQYINENRHAHVLTIEDPIEFVYRDMKSSITQRELGSVTHSFHEALYAGLRQDPDVIMIGELRDTKTIQTALTAAETGHLVLSTLHTNDAVSSIERILDVFPSESKNQIRIQLASTLVACISQRLLMRSDGLGRVPACEIMVMSPSIESYIQREEFKKISYAVENSNSYYKMQSMNMDLEKLVRRKTITLDEALKASSSPDDLRLKMSGVMRDEGYSISNAGGGGPRTSIEEEEDLDPPPSGLEINGIKR